MGLLNALKAIIYKLDLLDSGSLLRIKGEPEHKTLLGGIISFSLMILLAAAFWNKIVATFDKTIITSTTAISNADDPTSFNLMTLPAGPFMLGVQVFNHDLNGPIRYFDIELSHSNYQYGAFQNITLYSLQPCKKDHWVGYPKIQDKYDAIGISNWMCLPMNSTFQLKGKYSSFQSQIVNILAKKCSNSFNDTRPCANQSSIDDLFTANGGNLFFSVYFLNPIINPDSEDYIEYYLQDNNYIMFSQNGGQEARLFVQDYSIKTDQSILPNQDIRIESGGLVTDNVLKSTFTTISNIYAAFYFFKSSTSIVYNRSFQKLDDVFSYIGGLFGTILILFFLISAYNTYKFEINIAGYLYHKQQRSQSAQKKYNFLYYLGQLIYTGLKLLNFNPNWEKLSYYYETRQEVLKQLDILLLMKRINFLQKSLTYLFTDHQLKGLYMANHYSISQAVSLRKRYKLKSKLKQQIKSFKKTNLSYQREENITDSFANNQFTKPNAHANRTDQDSFISQSQSIDHQFNSDRYSSQSSSEDDGEIHLFESLKTLRNEKDKNVISNNIWKNIDKRVQTIIQPICLVQQKRQQVLKEDNYEQLTINNFNSKDNMQQAYHLPFNRAQSARGRKQSSEKDDQDEKNIKNKTFAMLMFSKIKTVHPQNQIEANHKEK